MKNNQKYDIAIQGAWYTSNYGDVLTYYALYMLLSKELGYSVLMIDKTRDQNKIIWNDKDYNNPLVRNFTNKYYNVSKIYDTSSDARELNLLSDNFIVATDQCWNNYLYRQTGNMMFLDFVNTDKNKIAYSASFAHSSYLGTESERIITKFFLKQFNSISVREKRGISICKDDFEVEAEYLLDPIFVCSKQHFYDLINNHSLNEDNNLVSYILDPNLEKNELIDNIAKSNNLSPINIIDANYQNTDNNTKKLTNVTTINSIEEFLNYYLNAKFIITDSFHGTCLAILFNKPFITIINKERGYERFKSLLETFPINKNYFYNCSDVKQLNISAYNLNINLINDIISKEQKKSIAWLKTAINKPKPILKHTNDDIISMLSAFYTEMIKQRYVKDCKIWELEQKILIQKKNQKEEIEKIFNHLNNDINVLKLLYQKNKILRKYNRYKILSKILIGKKRKHYKEKAEIYHEKVRKIRKLQNEALNV